MARARRLGAFPRGSPSRSWPRGRRLAPPRSRPPRARPAPRRRSGDRRSGGRTRSATGCAARRPRSASPRTGCPPGSCTAAEPEARGSIRRILPSRDSRFCALPGGSSARTPVAGADVEHPVGPELQLAAVVVEEGRMRDRQHRPAARHRHGAAVGRVLVDLQRPVRAAGVEDVEVMACSGSRARGRPRAARARRRRSPCSACRGRGRCWRRRGRRAGSSRAARPPAPGRGRRAASSRRPGR